MAFKRLLQEIEDKFNEVKQLEEFATSNIYYTSIPAGSKTNALNVIKSNELLRLLILNKQLIYRLDMNEIIFESEHEKAIDLLNSKLYKGFFDCFLKILKERGPSGLYAGFIPIWARFAPTTCLQLVIFEQIKPIIGVEGNGE